ncbi:hypothetical protein GCM10010222_48290 [Streptomyces tanashiensis]|nr:hypothetical protein GCM10010222_48290 [Streptomyces tanashiensis]
MLLDEGLDLEGGRGTVGDVQVVVERHVQGVVAYGVGDEQGVPPRRRRGRPTGDDGVGGSSEDVTSGGSVALSWR